jgi:hypothetical protein
MRRQKAETMKLLKKFIIGVVASCVLAVGAMAVEPQKNEKPPPPKEKQDVPRPPKQDPPPRDNNNGNKGNNDGKRGGKP